MGYVRTCEEMQRPLPTIAGFGIVREAIRRRLCRNSAVIGGILLGSASQGVRSGVWPGSDLDLFYVFWGSRWEEVRVIEEELGGVAHEHNVHLDIHRVSDFDAKHNANMHLGIGYYNCLQFYQNKPGLLIGESFLHLFEGVCPDPVQDALRYCAKRTRLIQDWQVGSSKYKRGVYLSKVLDTTINVIRRTGDALGLAPGVVYESQTLLSAYQREVPEWLFELAVENLLLKRGYRQIVENVAAHGYDEVAYKRSLDQIENDLAPRVLNFVEGNSTFLANRLAIAA